MPDLGTSRAISPLQAVGIGLAITAVIGLAIWWEVSLWSECRSDHSFFYCLRVLGK